MARNAMHFTDQTGHTFTLKTKPGRIVSLVPSQTELLCDLGLADALVGVTRFCTRPAGVKDSRVRVGGTKDFTTDTVLSLKPDLVIANKEENERERVELLRSSLPVYTSDIATLEDAITMITDVGKMTGTELKASELTGTIQSEFDALKSAIDQRTNQPMSALYLIWRKPWMTIGSDTFIADMIRHCGLAPVAEELRYPVIHSIDSFKDKVDVVLLSSEPYPFNEGHMAELSALFPESRIFLVDGELFSWYGSRLLHAPDYFKNLMLKVHS
jgi:ABC-type Fe3+-hydroxamate transport system substrate-binding protein